jgi:hypothetical protein
MSVQSDVHTFLATVAKGADGDFVTMDPGKVAEQVGTTRNKVNKTLFNLTATGKIELQRGKNGRSITGFKLLEGPGEPRTPRSVRKVGRPRLEGPVVIRPDQPRRRRGIPTPNLDDYASAKETFARLSDELGDLIDAQFRQNPWAEEGLLLRDRLAQIEGNYSVLVQENETLRRDVRALRGRVNRELAESVARSESANGG